MEALGWPERGTAGGDGLRCNRLYTDLRRCSWTQAQAVLGLEDRFISILESATDFEANIDRVNRELEELYDDEEEGLFGLDLGVASSVIALSAARCVPFSSCNGGAFGDMHHERIPLVAFFAMRAWLPVLVSMAEEANVGIVNSGDGLVVYGEIQSMLGFARVIIRRRREFRRLRATTADKSPNTLDQRLPGMQRVLPFEMWSTLQPAFGLVPKPRVQLAARSPKR
ncbi:MAG: hypothetical protein QOJ64_2311 [Acidobacteriota bacterium]|nr:hypothetical protein [Acidobacteriota bacterium]